MSALRRAAGVVTACILGAGVAQASPVPAGHPFAEAADSGVVIRFQGTVPVPFETAYLNVLRQAQVCWATLPGIAPQPQRVIENDVDLLARHGAIIVTHPAMGPGVALISVRLRSEGTLTHIDGAAMKSTPGAPHLGSADIHALGQWAQGGRPACAGGTMPR